MGVRDLGAVVKRYAPAAVKPVPSLASLANKTVAIDANLLTTKFHYAGVRPSPADLGFGDPDAQARQNDWLARRERHRHVRGWYWLLKALERENIKAIVVFDGDTRLPAKSRENTKRRAKRLTERSRGLAEQDRGQRLRDLKTLWDGVQEDDRRMVAQAFRQMVLSETAQEAAQSLEERGSSSSEAETVVDEIVAETAIATAIAGPASAVQTQIPEKAPELSSSAQVTTSMPEDAVPKDVAVGVELDELSGKDEQFVTAQTMLWPDTKVSTSVTTTGTQPELEATNAEDIGRKDDNPNEARTSVFQVVKDGLQTPLAMLGRLYNSFRSDELNPVYSRNQKHLSLEERAFFNSMLRTEEDYSDGDDGSSGITLVDLSAAIAKSDEFGSTHLWRSMGVPAHAFEDTEKLVTALGLPWIKPDPEQPYEAEGVCSALYRLGMADYVVSEDTDVAVYGAPLLRKLSVVQRQVTSNEESNVDDAVEDVDNFPDAEDIFASAADPDQPRRSQDMMNVLDAETLRTELGLDREQFVDFALLCGTDFTERIPSVGPARALQLIKQYSTIEAVLNEQSKYLPQNVDEYLEDVQAARRIFLGSPELPLIYNSDNLNGQPYTSPDLGAMLRLWGIYDPNVTAEHDLLPDFSASADAFGLSFDDLYSDDGLLERALSLNVSGYEVDNDTWPTAEEIFAEPLP